MRMKETDLPGVGAKFSLTLAAGDRLEVVAYTSGDREIFLFTADRTEVSHVVHLESGEACALGAVLCTSLRTDTSP